MGDGVSQWSSIANNFPGPRTELVYNFDSDLAPEEGHAAIRYTNIKSNRRNEGFHNYDFFAKIKKKNINFNKNSHSGIMLQVMYVALVTVFFCTITHIKLLMYKRNCRSVPEWVTTS